MDDLRQYLFANRIPATAAAVSIGTVTKDFIQTLVVDLLIPMGLAVIKYMLPAPWADQVDFVEGDAGYFNLRRVSEMCIIWVSVIFTSYFLLDYLLQRTVIGVPKSAHRERR